MMKFQSRRLWQNIKANSHFINESPIAVICLLGTAIADLFTPLVDVSGPSSLIFLFLSLVFALSVGQAECKRAMRTGLMLRVKGLFLSVFFTVGFSLAWGASALIGSPKSGVLTHQYPQLAELQSSMIRLISSSEGMAAALESINAKIPYLKQEVSSDPRKELANMGIAWNAEEFLNAIERGDRRVVQLFFVGGMRPDVRTDKTVLFYALARNAPDIRWTLSKFVEAGLDINKPMQISLGLQSAYLNDNWRTPLFVAALNENYEALDYLIEVGAERKYAIREVQQILDKIDAKELEKQRMLDLGYCTRNMLENNRDGMREYANSTCIIDSRACIVQGREDKALVFAAILSRLTN